MNRREFLALTSLAGFDVMLAGGRASAMRSSSPETAQHSLNLLPFPQSITINDGQLRLGKPVLATKTSSSATVGLAINSLSRFLPADGKKISVRLGSLEEGYDSSWLAPDENEFL